MKKRFLAVLLSMATLSSVFVGCSSSDQPATDKTQTSQDAGTEKDSEDKTEAESTEPVEISMLYSDNAAYPYKEDWSVLQWIEEEAGVKLDLQPVPESDWAIKKELVLNSNDIPDIIARSFATSTDVASGIILPISQYEDRMPNFQKFVEENGLRDELEATRFSDGNYYTLPSKMRQTKLQDQQWLVRTDILEANNLPIPTTMDELYEVGMKLKEIYPDSTPITNRFGSGNIMSGFASAFGTIAGWTIGDGMYYDHDAKEWSYAPTSDNWKQMVTYVNKLVEGGVLDQEFTTLDSTVYEQRIVQGQTFLMYDWAANIDRYNKQGKEIDPNYNVTPVYPMAGTEDHYAVGWKQPWDQGYVFPAALAEDEDQLNAVLSYIDWGYSDEAETLLTFGKEGETYVVNENGSKVFKDPTIDYNAAYGLDNNSLCIRQDSDVILGKFNAEQIALFDKIAADDVVPTPNPQSPLTPDELEESQIYTSTLLDYINSMMEKFIFGSEPLENWDTFVTECENKGSTKLEELYTK